MRLIRRSPIQWVRGFAAAADAKKDFGIAAVDFKVPTEWKLALQTELLESLAAQGYNAFGIFPADPDGRESAEGVVRPVPYRLLTLPTGVHCCE